MPRLAAFMPPVGTKRTSPNGPASAFRKGTPPEASAGKNLSSEGARPQSHLDLARGADARHHQDLALAAESDDLGVRAGADHEARPGVDHPGGVLEWCAPSRHL